MYITNSMTVFILKNKAVFQFDTQQVSYIIGMTERKDTKTFYILLTKF